MIKELGLKIMRCCLKLWTVNRHGGMTLCLNIVTVQKLGLQHLLFFSFNKLFVTAGV